jgi:exodeoxyribonuclease VII large subunit
MKTMEKPDQPMSVAELTRRIRLLLEQGFPTVTVLGEISNFKRHSSGHIYFTLKDEAAQLSAVLWRSRAGALHFVPEDGLKVVVTGRITVYEVRGSYQIDVHSIRPLGAGELQIAFEQLKEKLRGEGLFDRERKRPMPILPERIGFVTSPTGSVLHDMRTILARRFPGIQAILRPVRVQGAGAAGEIAEALHDFNSVGGVDLIILARGGGSLEDLWPFNEEIVARAIAGSHIPVVSAVGHETDTTIADFVADLRAPTPSAAIELVVPDRRELLESVANYWYRTGDAVTRLLSQRREQIRHLLASYSFNRPIDLLRQYSQRSDELRRSLTVAMRHGFDITAARHGALQQRFAALDPGSVLKRGYAIVRQGGRIVGRRGNLQRTEGLRIEFADGNVDATMT